MPVEELVAGYVCLVMFVYEVAVSATNYPQNMARSYICNFNESVTALACSSKRRISEILSSRVNRVSKYVKSRV